MIQFQGWGISDRSWSSSVAAVVVVVIVVAKEQGFGNVMEIRRD